MMLKCI